MSVADQLGISEELLVLVEQAFDHALPTLRESGEPFNPFVMSEGGAEPHFQRVIAPETEEAVAFARRSIASLPADTSRYAIAFDGRVTLHGTKHDAVIVEAGDRGSDFGVVFALCYRPPTSEGGAFEEVGNPTFLGRGSNYFEQQAEG